VQEATGAKIVSTRGMLCDNGCEGEDAEATHWCRVCKAAICDFCVVGHRRQKHLMGHELTEISQATAPDPVPAAASAANAPTLHMGADKGGDAPAREPSPEVEALSSPPPPKRRDSAAAGTGERADCSRRCDFTACSKQLTAPLRCARCKEAVYCSKDCQTKAWKAGHKRECVPAKGAAEAIQTAKRSGAMRQAAHVPRSQATRSRTVPLPAHPVGGCGCTLTAEQLRLGKRLVELEDADDYLGVVALELGSMEMVRDVREAEPGTASRVLGVLGRAFKATGQYARAKSLLEESKAIAEELGDLTGLAVVCANLGVCYARMRDHARSREMHEQEKAIWEKLGDRAGVATACANLGACYFLTKDYARALVLLEKAKAIKMELGDRAGVAAECHNLGNCYHCMGEYGRALALHGEDRAISEELRDRAGVARATAACRSAEQAARPEPAPPTAEQQRLKTRLEQLEEARDWQGIVAHERQFMALARDVRGEYPSVAGSIHMVLGRALRSVGEYARALVQYQESKAIAEELGIHANVAAACDGLGTCYVHTGEYAKALVLHGQSKVIAEELGDREVLMRACGNLGNCYAKTGEYALALGLYQASKAIAEEVGDRAEAARACGNLGNCYESMGEYARAKTLLEHEKAAFEDLGDRAGVARASSNLGVCYLQLGEHRRALEIFQECKVMAEEVGDRVNFNVACGNLGICYEQTGEYARAITLLEQSKAISEEVGDREAVAVVCANLGNCYCGTGEHGRALALYEECAARAEEIGDPEAVAKACYKLGEMFVRMGEYTKAISFFERQYTIGKDLEVRATQEKAALCMGVALRLHVRADRQASGANLAIRVGAEVEIHSLQRSPELNGVRGKIVETLDLATGRWGVKVATGRAVLLKPANLLLIPAGASDLPGAHSSAPAYLEDRVREAEKWLQTALDGGDKSALLHLAHLAFDAGFKDTALDRLKDYLSTRVEAGRYVCDGCRQIRGEGTPMLTCSGCHVARFCSADHQKLASRSVASGGNFVTGRHKDICGVLGKWRRVVKDGESPDSLNSDLQVFLQQ